MTEPTSKAGPIVFERDGLRFEVMTRFYVAPMYRYSEQPATSADLAAAGYHKNPALGVGWADQIAAVEHERDLAKSQLAEATAKLESAQGLAREWEQLRNDAYGQYRATADELEAAERELAGVRRLCGRNLAASTPDELRALFRQLIAVLAKPRDQRQPVGRTVALEPDHAQEAAELLRLDKRDDLDGDQLLELDARRKAWYDRDQRQPVASGTEEPEATSVVEHNYDALGYCLTHESFDCRHKPLSPAVTRAAEALHGAVHNAATWQSVVRDHIDDAINNPHDPSTDALIGAVCLLRDQLSLLTDQPNPMLRCPTYGELIATLREVRTGFGGPAGELASELAKHLEHRATGGGK